MLYDIRIMSNIVKGEKTNIFPYQDSVDEVTNSAVIYEIGVLKIYVELLLYNVSEINKEYSEVLRLNNF